jgi:hypothetical protein
MDQMFDLGLTLLEFGKALEVRCNNLLREAVDGPPGSVRYLNIDGTGRDVTATPLGLHDLARYLSDRETGDYLCRNLTEYVQLFAVELPPSLDDFARVRNVVAHHTLGERDVVVQWRNRPCGVEQDRVLERLGVTAIPH